MNIHNKDEFAKAFTDLDATNTPEEIRNAIDRDIEQEILHSKSGKTYAVVYGELKQVEGA